MNNSNKAWHCKSCLEDDYNRVGIKFSEDGIDIYFPLGYDIPLDTEVNLQRKAVIDLLFTLSLTKEIDSENDFTRKTGNATNFPIYSYLWILNDYINNGLYNVKEKRYIRSQTGKVNWKRTFSTVPIYSKQGAIYLDPYVEKDLVVDNIITEIHALCINHSIEQIGWLFGNIEKVNFKYNDKNKNYYLSILDEELRRSFSDKKKTLISNMIAIIKSKVNDNSFEKISNILTLNYNHAWEKMIDSVFGNDLIENYRPELTWNGLPEKVSTIHMSPDTVIKNKKNRELFIIDSKYYKYGVINNGKLPGAEDIDKQITYGDYCSNPNNFDKPLEYDINKIYNAFVVPYNKNDNRFNYRSDIVYLGYAESRARNTTDSFLHKKVALVLIDTKYVIDCYLKKEIKDADKLLDSIREGLLEN